MKYILPLCLLFFIACQFETTPAQVEQIPTQTTINTIVQQDTPHVEGIKFTPKHKSTLGVITVKESFCSPFYTLDDSSTTRLTIGYSGTSSGIWIVRSLEPDSVVYDTTKWVALVYDVNKFELDKDSIVRHSFDYEKRVIYKVCLRKVDTRSYFISSDVYRVDECNYFDVDTKEKVDYSRVLSIVPYHD